MQKLTFTLCESSLLGLDGTRAAQRQPGGATFRRDDSSDRASSPRLTGYLCWSDSTCLVRLLIR